MSEHGSLTIPSWEPEQLGSTEGPTNAGPTPCVGEAHNPPQTSGISCRSQSQWALPTHPNYVFPTPPLPSPTEKLSPNKLLLSPPPVWAGNRHQRAACKQRQGQNQSGTPGALRAKEKRGNHSCSRRCNGLNPHNKPETANSRGNCGFGEQV